MNLRTKKTLRKRRKQKNLLLIVFAYAVIIGISFFSVFAYTIYLDSLSEKINEDITVKDQEIYKYQREIKNLKIKLENYSRKDYIVARINSYNLKLGTPSDYQVINLGTDGFYYNNTKSFAYNN